MAGDCVPSADTPGNEGADEDLGKDERELCGEDVGAQIIRSKSSKWSLRISLRMETSFKAIAASTSTARGLCCATPGRQEKKTD